MNSLVWISLTFFLLVFVHTSSQVSRNPCPLGWTHNPFGRQNQCFILDKEARNWREAREFCKSLSPNDLHVDLATILDTHTNEFIGSMIKNKGRFWIGLNDLKQEGIYEWVNTNMSLGRYKPWESNSPNNYDNQDHVIIDGEYFQWNDRNGERKSFPSVCEIFEIDECEKDNGNCHQNCINRFGGYDCACNASFRLSRGSHCIDIDECHDSNTTHNCEQKCHNTVGSFICLCEKGYTQDGSRCIPEKKVPYALILLLLILLLLAALILKRYFCQNTAVPVASSKDSKSDEDGKVDVEENVITEVDVDVEGEQIGDEVGEHGDVEEHGHVEE